MSLAVIKPIWLTDLYAISDFKSVCRIQIILAIIAPSRVKLIRRELRVILICWNENAIRSSPYPPSFSRIPARIIDPDTGAST